MYPVVIENITVVDLMKMIEDHERNNPLTQEDTRLKTFSRDFLKETHNYCNEYLNEYFSSSKRCIPKMNKISCVGIEMCSVCT